ncbi:MAG: hypothetical protein ACXVW7_18785 [Trebonia sp.]
MTEEGTELTTPTRTPSPDELAEETRTANAIYGLIVCSGVMAAGHRDSAGQLAVAVLVALVIYWAAERYAHAMARRIVFGPAESWRVVVRDLGRGWEMVTASFLPLLVLVVTYRLGATLATSVLIALIVSTVVLCAAGWRVGSEARLRPLQRVFSALGAGAFGFVMILLKMFLH